MSISNLLHTLAALDGDVQFIPFESPALSPHPKPGMGDGQRETLAADITASASRAADALSCEWGCENGYTNKNIDGCDVMVRCMGCNDQPEGY